ncbi:alpha/beta hydrolase [Kitasatospora indigofera]|uniref:alpha/beta hydrolase n=1 Tax=Kitasatospora indigofera TaxID=67307 RepID=UPI003677B67D
MEIDTVLKADFTGLAAARAGYDALVTAFNAHVEAWKRTVVDRLHNSGWTGSAATRAFADLDLFASKLLAADDELKLVSGVLADAQQSIALVQAELIQALDDAKAAGITVKPDGAMSWENKDDTFEVKAKSLSLRVQDALHDAQHADDAITRRLRHFAENATTGTGLDATAALADKAGAGTRETPPDARATPAQVKAWWDGLTPAEQQHLIHNRPEQIGNRDGVPCLARDQANRIILRQRRAELQGELDRIGKPGPPMIGPGNTVMGNPGEDRIRTIKDQLKGIDDIQEKLDHSKAPLYQPTFLLGFDTKDNGHALVAVNNPDTADNVLTFVPGTKSKLGEIKGDMDKSYEMANSAYKAADGSKKTTATITWTGYDAPQEIVPGALFGQNALDARDDLHNFQTGLRATHEGVPSNNTIMGHSYGSAVVGMAMRDRGLPVDSAVFVGSPGVGVDNIKELQIDPSRVFVARGDKDTVAPWAEGIGGSGGIYGADPADPAFGATVVPTSPGTDHGHYWNENSASWKAFGRIATGGRP